MNPVKEGVNGFFREKYNSIYVRGSFKDAYDSVKSDEPSKTILLTGNQGIGKSVFIVYYLFKKRLEQDKTKVIIVDRVTYPTYCLTYDDNGLPLGLLGTRDDFSRVVLENDNIIYLCDGQPAIQRGCSFLMMISSPNKNNYHVQMKTGDTETFVMPLWKEEELIAAGTLVYKQPEKDVKERFQIWGGIPRYVLEKVDKKELSIIDDAIQSSDIESLFTRVNQANFNDKDSSVLVHLESDRNYTGRKAVVASPFIMKRLVSKFMQTERGKLKDRVFYCQTYDELGGELYEEISHQTLIAGGKFKIKKLQDEKENKFSSGFFEISRSNFNIFNGNKDLQLKPPSQDEYYRPKQKHYLAIDSFKGNNLFQMTVSQNHSVVFKEFINFINILSKQYTEFHLIFVVPPTNYEQFHYQEYKDEKGIKKDPPPNVTQYALSLEFQ